MQGLKTILAFIAAAIMLPVHAGSADTLSYEEGTTGDSARAAEITAVVSIDTETAFRYAALYPIGDNGPVNIGVPATRYSRLLYNGFDTRFETMPDSAAAPDSLRPKWYNTRLVRSSIFPLAMIGYSLTVMKDNGLYSSYDAKRDIRNLFGSYRSPVDDYLIWAPYAELGLLNLFKIRCKTDAINTSLLILKSELLMTAIVFPVKQLSNQLRPDSSNTHSFPSGHTANAFVAASVVHKEYRHLSPWYGVGAYTVATSVALFRMINNKHWQSDVIAGAGIGLLATHIVYATHRYRWGRKDVCFVPTIGKNRYGGALVYQF